MKNNKGVTLVELLVVIVVMGIIAGFAIPAVGNIITNAEKDAILNDAIQVENAAKLYCSSAQCDAGETLSWAQLEPYISGLNPDSYAGSPIAATDTLSDLPNTIIATENGGSWEVTLDAIGIGTGADTDPWEVPASSVPNTLDRDDLVRDAN